MGIDLTGKRFGRLVVIRKTEERKNRLILWECKCDCGNITTSTAVRLREGRKKSCGCLRLESNRRLGDELFKKYMDGEWLREGTCLVRLSEKIPSNNTSGIKGVTWNKQRGLWRAQIKLKGKFKYLGCFANIEDAAKARKEAEEKYFTPILEKYGRLEK